MDSNQFSMPSSFYQLRPLNECQQSQNHQLIQQKQSSMKEISYFQKNDNHLIDQVIEDGHPHYHHAFLVNHKYNDQRLPQQSEQEDSSPLKRNQPSYRQKNSKFEYKSKIFHQIQQSTIKVQHKENENKNIPTKKCKKITKNLPMKQIQKSFNNKQQKDSEDEQLPYEIAIQIKNKNTQRYHKSYNKKNIDNQDFSTVNQFVELMSYATLIDQLITIYDNSPLFIDPLDFNSQDENSQQFKFQIEDSSSIVQFYEISEAAPKNQNVQMKIQQIQQQKQNREKNEEDNNLNQVDSMISQVKLQQNSYINKRTKQQMFQSSKTYMNFVDSIDQMKPYIKRMTIQQKQIFLMFKRQLKEIKEIIDYFQKRINKILIIFVKSVEIIFKVEDNLEDICQENIQEKHYNME